MEYRVNEIFELLGHKLKAVQAPTSSCEGCWLYREIGCMYRGIKCISEERHDSIDIIIKKV